MNDAQRRAMTARLKFIARNASTERTIEEVQKDREGLMRYLVDECGYAVVDGSLPAEPCPGLAGLGVLRPTPPPDDRVWHVFEYAGSGIPLK